MTERSQLDERCAELLAFYFGEVSSPTCDLDTLKARTKFWFFRNAETDATIRARFADDVERAIRGELDSWRKAPRSSLGLVVLLDQFSRNLNRDSPRAFEQDAKALAVTLEGLEHRFDEELSAGERLVYYLPLMHTEDVAMQRRACDLYKRLAESAPEALRPELESAHSFAGRHREIVERFGRFPHRNKALGRTSTPEELEFLTQPGSSF